MSSAVTGIALPHSSLLQTQSTLLFPFPSCVFHFNTSLLSPYFPLIILPPGLFSYYFPHLFPFPFSLPHFHPVVQFLVSLILNCGQVVSILRRFMTFLSCPGEFQECTLKYAVTISCSFFIFILQNTT